MRRGDINALRPHERAINLLIHLAGNEGLPQKIQTEHPDTLN